jgi:hypothetical protein
MGKQAKRKLQKPSKPPRPLWNPDWSAAENAAVNLPLLAAHFLDAGDHVAANTESAAELHAFRLEAKRLRYTLELLRQCYGKAMKARLQLLRGIQDHLGGMQDCVATRALVARVLGRNAPERQQIEAKLAEIEQQHVEGFREHWRAHFEGPANRRRWVQYLSVYAGKANAVEE